MKQAMKKVLALGCTAALLVSCLTACGGGQSSQGNNSASSQGQGTPATTGRKLAMICGSAEMPFTQVLVAGAQSAVREGDELTIYYCDWDAAKEIQQMEDICANGVDLLMIDPADPHAILPGLQTALDANIPVISYDCSTEYPEYLKCQISSDDYEAGYLIAKELFEALGGEGVIQSYVTNTTKNSQLRFEGLQKALEEYPNVELVYNCEERFDPESAVRVFEQMLQAHPETNAFFCANENIVKAAVTVLESNGLKGEVLLGNVGAGTMIKDYLNDGSIYCSYDSQPYIMGQQTIEACYEILDNGTEYDANDPIMVPGEIRKMGDDYFAG